MEQRRGLGLAEDQVTCHISMKLCDWAFATQLLRRMHLDVVGWASRRSRLRRAVTGAVRDSIESLWQDRSYLSCFGNVAQIDL